MCHDKDSVCGLGMEEWKMSVPVVEFDSMHRGVVKVKPLQL